MLNNLSQWLQQKSNGWVTIAILVLFMLFTTFVLPGQASSAKVNTGIDQSPDTSFLYSVDDLYQIAQAYGEQGRDYYIKARFTFDLIWPLVYMAFLTTTISWSYLRAFKPDSILQKANLTPLLGMLFDYLENIAASIVMGRYPTHTTIIEHLTPIFTLVKWIFVGGSFGLLVFGLVVGILRWVKGKYKV